MIEIVREASRSLRATSAKSRNVGEAVAGSRPKTTANATVRAADEVRGTAKARSSSAAATTGAADSTKNEPTKPGMPERPDGENTRDSAAPNGVSTMTCATGGAAGSRSDSSNAVTEMFAAAPLAFAIWIDVVSVVASTPVR